MNRYMVYCRRKNKNVGDAVTPQPIEAKGKDAACRMIHQRHPKYPRSRLFAVEMVKTVEQVIVDGPPEVEIPLGGVRNIGVIDGVAS